MSNSQTVDLKSTVVNYLGKIRSVVGEGDWSDGAGRSKEFADLLCDHLIVLVKDEPTLDLKSVTGYMAKLQSVLDKGNWSAQSSKELADLLCVHLLKLVKKLPCTSTTTHGELDRSESGRTTEAVSADPEVITEKKRTLDPEVITEKERDAEAVTEKKRALDPEVTTEKERDAETVTEKKRASGVMTKRVLRKRQSHDRDDIQESAFPSSKLLKSKRIPQKNEKHYFPSWKPDKCKRISRKSDEPSFPSWKPDKSKRISRKSDKPGAFYSSKPNMPTNKVVGKNTQRMTNRIVIKQERTDDDLKKKIDDGLKWRKYGIKIKNGKYPRQYYACSEKGCHVTKHVQRIDDGHVEIIYFDDHNCKQQQQQHPAGSEYSHRSSVNDAVEDWFTIQEEEFENFLTSACSF